MKRSHRLSLRARHARAAIGVTVIHLLIMGTVSTIVLKNQWTKPVLRGARGGRDPQSGRASAKPDGYPAVRSPSRYLLTPHVLIGPLTSGNSTQERDTQALVAGLQQLAASGRPVEVPRA